MYDTRMTQILKATQYALPGDVVKSSAFEMVAECPFKKTAAALKQGNLDNSAITLIFLMDKSAVIVFANMSVQFNGPFVYK